MTDLEDENLSLRLYMREKRWEAPGILLQSENGTFRLSDKVAGEIVWCQRHSKPDNVEDNPLGGRDAVRGEDHSLGAFEVGPLPAYTANLSPPR